jgi:probable F420-dependent oxidoreductase
VEVVVKVGAATPHLGADASPEGLLGFAARAEELGLDSLWVLERLMRVIPDEGEPFIPAYYGSVYSPLETLAFLAGRTSTIKLGTSVLDALFHAPVALARQLSTLDNLSGGRLVVGLGQGWSAEEFAAVGVPMSRRGKGFEDFLGALQAAWQADPVHYEGRFYSFARSEVSPKPVQVGGPQLLLAAMPGVEVSVERAGRLGLGFNPGIYTWESFEHQMKIFRDSTPRGAEPGPVVVRVNGSVTAEPLGDERAPLTGDIAEVRADLARAAALGVTEVFWDLVQGGVAAAAEQHAAIERIATLKN